MSQSERKLPLMLNLQDLYLCPGDGNGAHVTDNAVACACGNQNLASLARILDRETVVVSMLDIIKEEHPETAKGIETLFEA